MLQEPPERLTGLLREQQRLLKKIGHQKRDTARLRERIQEVARRFAGEQDVVEECRRLDGEIHALFTELLARKCQPGGTRTRSQRDKIALAAAPEGPPPVEARPPQFTRRAALGPP